MRIHLLVPIVTEDQRVLDDDGPCPKGQIKEAIGGNHTKVGGKKQLAHTRRCIAR